MRIKKLDQIVGMLAVVATLCGADAGFAQNAAAPSSMKTIGAPAAAAKPEIVPGGDGAAAFFIDIIGRPFTPMSRERNHP